MRKGARIALWVVGAVVAVAVLALAGFVIWASTPLGPSPEAEAALVSGRGVNVSENAGAWVFEPQSVEATAGLILYPGGRVDARSYAPLAREVASRGYLVAVPEVTLSLAFFEIGAAEPVIEAYPGVTTWVLGGHSLGGVASTLYTKDHPEQVDGLALLASYPTEGGDLSALAVPATSVRGTLDGLVTPEEIAASLPLLPADTEVVELEGGNHAQFGAYGPQGGDNPATIPASEQWALTADAIERVIEAATGAQS